VKSITSPRHVAPPDGPTARRVDFAASFGDSAVRPSVVPPPLRLARARAARVCALRFLSSA
jgi:hypothetical protein